ncbi:menaquinol-cytochrome c reductase iron-sulfur subunit [Paenibacillus sp. 1_12]|nr:menaquinol-cytochrome c reductase iron-sulfur subunit [Paenibacillus sp. 1_12]
MSTSCKLALGAAGVLAGSTGLFYYGAVQQSKRRGESALELPGNIIKLGEFNQLNAISSVEKVDYEATIRDGWVTKSNKGFVFVTKDADGKLLVISPVCTHLGCYVEQASEAQQSAKKNLFFLCPCHGAEFDVKGNAIGVVLRGLDTYKPVIVNSSVYIDILSPVSRV